MKEFGDKGHDYERAAEDDAALEEGALERIDSLLEERLQHLEEEQAKAVDVACAQLLDARGACEHRRLRRRQR